MTYEAETVERVAGIFYDLVRVALRDFNVGEEVISGDVEMHGACELAARAALSTMPPQEVSGQEAAKAYHITANTYAELAEAMAEYIENLDQEDVPGHVLDAVRRVAAGGIHKDTLRALAGETGE